MDEIPLNHFNLQSCLTKNIQVFILHIKFNCLIQNYLKFNHYHLTHYHNFKFATYYQESNDCFLQPIKC